MAGVKLSTRGREMNKLEELGREVNTGQSSPQNMLDENFRLQTSLLWWTYDWRLKHIGLLMSFLKATAPLEPKTGREQIFAAALPASFLFAAVAPSSTISIPAVFLPFNQQDDSSCMRSRGESCVWRGALEREYRKRPQLSTHHASFRAAFCSLWCSLSLKIISH